MLVISGSADTGIGENIAKSLGAEYLSSSFKTFPDGEMLVRADCDAKNEDVVIVQSTYAPQDRHLMELFFLSQSILKQKPLSITAVVPYLAYLRQDKPFTPGESVSAEAVLDLLYSAGISNLVVVQPHKLETLEKFKGKSKAVLPVKSLMDYALREIENPYLLAPDKGSFPFAKEAAKLLNCDCTFIDKERNISTGEVSIKNAPAERFDGKNVIIFDDMISTGGTTAQAAKFAYSRGASDVIAIAVHLLMSGNAFATLRESGISGIYGANTIPAPNTYQIDVSEEIASAVRSLI